MSTYTIPYGDLRLTECDVLNIVLEKLLSGTDEIMNMLNYGDRVTVVTANPGATGATDNTGVLVPQTEFCTSGCASLSLSSIFIKMDKDGSIWNLGPASGLTLLVRETLTFVRQK